MGDPIEPLILDLLEWIGPVGRSYADALDAWMTSCPRLPVWEEAHDRGLLGRRRACGRTTIELTPIGRALLERDRDAPAPGGDVPED